VDAAASGIDGWTAQFAGTPSVVAASRMVHSGATCAQPVGAALRLFPRPGRAIEYTVSVCSRFGGMGQCGGSRGSDPRKDPDHDGRACLHQVGTLRSVAIPPLPLPLSPRHCVIQPSESTMACARGGRAAAQAEGGVVKGRQCACKHTPTL